MCWGAVIGAGTSAVSYGLSATITGSWNSSSFWQSVGMGAIGGMIGGGLSSIGGTFANSLGYNILSQTGGNVATNAIFGNDLSIKAIPGMIAGGLVSSFLPNYNAVQGGWFRNLATEVGINVGRGAVSGFAAGLTDVTIMNEKSNAIWQKVLGGAMNGASTTLATNIIFGTGKYYDDLAVFGNKGSKPVYRNGGIASILAPENVGISWGRTSWANIAETDGTALYNHEGTHWRQQQRDGFTRFYGTIAKDYINSIRHFKSTSPLYTGRYLPGNYEDVATKIQYGRGIWSW